jgi:hypothetical protein
MSSTTATAAGSRAIERLLELLSDAGIEASRDPGAFYPQPTGVLVGLPTLAGRGMGSRTFSIPVLVVSGDPLNATLPVDRVLALVDDVALVLHTDNYRPSSYRSSSNAEPLPAFELDVTVTVPEEVSAP